MLQFTFSMLYSISKHTSFSAIKKAETGEKENGFPLQIRPALSFFFLLSFYMLKLIHICKVFLHALNKMTIASCFELFLQALLLAMWNSWNAMEQNATWIFRQQYGTYFGVHNLWHSPPWQYCPCKKSISHQKLQTNTKAYCAVLRKKGHDDHSF